MWGLELSLLLKNFCNIIILQSVGQPPGGGGSMEFDYIMSLPLLTSCGGFFFMSLDVEYLFW